MRFLLPAATDLAKSARMSSNISLQTALATFHTVWPVAGSTNPVTSEPFEAMMAKRNRPLANRHPHAARDRLQANAVFVHGPDFDGCARMLAPGLAGRRL